VVDRTWNDGRRFAGRVALVTGAGGTLGGAVAKGFGLEGASVVVGYRSSQAEAEDVAAEIVARLNTLQAQLVFGYPSMLARLAREQLAGRLRITPAAFTSTSETLVPEYRAAIAGAFGVPVVNTFAATEGLIGSSEPDGTVLKLASDGCIVELVDERNRPVPPATG